MKRPTEEAVLRWLAVLCGMGALAGGLIGYGLYGTAQDCCVGAGVGILAPPLLLLVALFVEVAFDGVGDGGLAGAGETVEPDHATALFQQAFLVLAFEKAVEFGEEHGK